MQFSYRVDGTGVFSINSEGFVMLASDELDYETTDKITFKVQNDTLGNELEIENWKPLEQKL